MQDVVWYNMLVCIAWNLGVLVLLGIIFHPKMNIRRRLLYITNTKEDYIIEDSTKFFAWDALEASHLTQSPVFSKGAILCFRILMLVYFMAAMLNDEYGAGTGLGPPQVWFTFYTNWSFVLFTTYQVNGIYIIFYRAKDDKQKPYGIQYTNPLTLNEKLSLLIQSALIPCALFSTIFYWCFTKKGFIFGEFMLHGMNCIFLLIDLFFVRAPIVTSHFIATLIFSQVYVTFLWLEGVFAENWIYKELDWSKTQGVLINILAAPALLIFFVVMYFVAYIRERTFFQKLTLI